MNSAFFDDRYTKSGGRFSRKFCLDAPRQVIGFDLPAKTGKSGLTLDDGGDDSHAAFGGDGKPGCVSDCVQSSFVNSETAGPESAKMRSTSPKSALQQLLLPTVDYVSPFPEAVRISHELSSLEPASTEAAAAKQATTGAATTTFSVNSIPLPFTALSLPASEDLAKLATRHAFDSTSIDDKHRNRSPAPAVSERNYVGRIGKKSCQPAEATAIHILAGRSERGLGTIGNWDAEDRLPKGSNKSIRMQKAVIEIVRSCSLKPATDLRRDSVETKWNQTSMHIQNKIKKSSLFMLAATSPIHDYSNQCFHDPGADFYTPQGMDMEFLNSCYLCKRRVGEGHDIFMYSGDKAFCSMECRYQQMVMDERKERRAPPVIRAGASPAYQSYIDSKTSNIVINQTRTKTPATHHPITMNRSNFTNPAAACH